MEVRLYACFLGRLKSLISFVSCDFIIPDVSAIATPIIHKTQNICLTKWDKTLFSVVLGDKASNCKGLRFLVGLGR